MNKKQARIEALEFIITWTLDHIDRGDHYHRYPDDATGAKIEAAIYEVLEQLRRKINRAKR